MRPAQRAQTVFQRRKRIGGERRRLRERALRFADDADRNDFCGRVAKREPEPCHEQQRKAEDPEQRFGLAQKLAEAHQRELPQRVITHRAGAVP
jgi:hypothetical protein